MIIKLKNKDTLIVDDFKFRCAIGKNKVKKNKIDPALKKRKILLMNYKSAIKRYKEKASEAK